MIEQILFRKLIFCSSSNIWKKKYPRPADCSHFVLEYLPFLQWRFRSSYCKMFCKKGVVKFLQNSQEDNCIWVSWYTFIAEHRRTGDFWRLSLTLFRMRAQKGPSTSFSSVTSAKVGIIPQNFLTFSFNSFDTFV